MKNILIAVLLFVPGLVQGLPISCNFNGDETINTEDIVILMAWKTEYNIAVFKEEEVTIDNVEERASSLFGDRNISVSRLPNQEEDKLADEDKEISTNDIVYLMSFVVEQNIATFKKELVSFAKVEERAQSIFSELPPLSKLPGTPIGTASFTTTITGITTDP